MNYSHKFNLQALRFISFYQQSMSSDLTFYASPIEGGEREKPTGEGERTSWNWE